MKCFWLSLPKTAPNFLFEPTRCDSGAVFSNRAPRGSTRRWTATCAVASKMNIYERK